MERRPPVVLSHVHDHAVLTMVHVHTVVQHVRIPIPVMVIIPVRVVHRRAHRVRAAIRGSVRPPARVPAVQSVSHVMLGIICLMAGVWRVKMGITVQVITSAANVRPIIQIVQIGAMQRMTVIIPVTGRVHNRHVRTTQHVHMVIHQHRQIIGIIIQHLVPQRPVRVH